MQGWGLFSSPFLLSCKKAAHLQKLLPLKLKRLSC
uniref:Uncharacterized protein n=1 Tax=Anguilla anguilla TaxID=7936 RepID=A0A0E9RIJ9_ANGAN